MLSILLKHTCIIREQFSACDELVLHGAYDGGSAPHATLYTTSDVCVHMIIKHIHKRSCLFLCSHCNRAK